MHIFVSGDVLAKSFKWIYSKVCLCRICPGVAKRRIIRERRKLRQLARAVGLPICYVSIKKLTTSASVSSCKCITWKAHVVAAALATLAIATAPQTAVAPVTTPEAQNTRPAYWMYLIQILIQI